jgi:hypothetical protein
MCLTLLYKHIIRNMYITFLRSKRNCVVQVASTENKYALDVTQERYTNMY